VHGNANWDYRPATAADVPELARLLTLLGHPTTPAQLAGRWPGWCNLGNIALVAARRDDTLAGAVTIGRTCMLHKAAPVGRITALVVDEPERRSGIGAALVRLAEEALEAAGCQLVEVTSNARRHEAHQFYERIGYVAKGLYFAKQLAPGTSSGASPAAPRAAIQTRPPRGRLRNASYQQ
jgi:GNAT superfamily N-acetyltransferase